MHHPLISDAHDNFFVRMKGDAMLDAGINDNDLLRICLKKAPEEGDIIAAVVDQELVVRRYFKDESQIVLMAENVDFPSIILHEWEPFELCGVVEKNDLNQIQYYR